MIGIRRVLVGSIALVVLTVIAAPATAVDHGASGRSAARWTARQATVPTGGQPEDLQFFATDCPSPSTCVSYREAVLETLRYGSWRASLAPVPSGAPSPRAYELTDVACGAPGRCAADGGYQWDLRDGDDDFYFAQRRAVVARLVSR